MTIRESLREAERRLGIEPELSKACEQFADEIAPGIADEIIPEGLEEAWTLASMDELQKHCPQLIGKKHKNN